MFALTKLMKTKRVYVQQQTVVYRNKINCVLFANSNKTTSRIIHTRKAYQNKNYNRFDDILMCQITIQNVYLFGDFAFI